MTIHPSEIKDTALTSDPILVRIEDTSTIGTSVSPESLNEHFKASLKLADLPKTTRFHDLRHTCATLMIQRNIHPRSERPSTAQRFITLCPPKALTLQCATSSFPHPNASTLSLWLHSWLHATSHRASQ